MAGLVDVLMVNGEVIHAKSWSLDNTLDEGCIFKAILCSGSSIHGKAIQAEYKVVLLDSKSLLLFALQINKIPM